MKLQVGTDAKLPLCRFPSTDSPQRENAAFAGRAWWTIWGVLALLIVGNAFMAIKLFSLSRELKSIENQVVFNQSSYGDAVANEIDIEYEQEDDVEDIRQLEQLKLRPKRSPKNKLRPVCHLVGIGNTGNRNDPTYFSWARPDVRNSPSISTCHMNVLPKTREVKSILINKSGLYYVYAQVTFRTGGAQNSAIQVVRSDSVRNVSLMTSVVKQQTTGGATVSDSVSVGGVFYLRSEQRLSVADIRSSVQPSNIDQRSDYSYFGVVFLSKK
uniref:Uncharacterized protein LOC100180074 n=1 Tax=Phallusia mammillata TaxID=59560 RepID=A0A6F9DHV8_9ASCI|nr:uncharacterized protein LOC100180074 [Phallusia mammillata]